MRVVAEILRKRGGRTWVVVSDGFDLYRIKLMFSAQGIMAYGSPAPSSPIEADPTRRAPHSLREAFVCTLWYLGFRG